MAAGWSPPPTVNVYYGKPMLPDVSRVLACLHEKDVEFKLVNMYEGQHMPPDFLRLQASERLPVPCLDDRSTTIFESRAICRYIVEKYADRGNKYLLGRDMLERASIEQWLKTEERSFDPPSWTLFFHLAFSPLASLPEPDQALITENERRLAKVLDVYDQRLGESRYLAGNEFSLADLSHLPNSHYLARSKIWGHLFHSRKNVSRWWSKISNRPSWKEVVKILDEVGVLRELSPAHEATQQPSSEVHQPLHEKSPIRLGHIDQSTSPVSAQPPYTIPDTPQPEDVSQSAQTIPTRETNTKPSYTISSTGQPDSISPPSSPQITTYATMPSTQPNSATKQDMSASSTAQKASGGQPTPLITSTTPPEAPQDLGNQTTQQRELTSSLPNAPTASTAPPSSPQPATSTTNAKSDHFGAQKTNQPISANNKPSTEPDLSNKPVPRQNVKTDSKAKTQELKPAASADLSGSTNTVSSSKETSNGKSESTDVRVTRKPNPDNLDNLQSDSSTPAGAKSSSTAAQSIKKPSAPENEPIPLPGTTTPTTKASPTQSAVGPNTNSIKKTDPDALENLQSDSSTPAGAKSSSTAAQSIKKPSAPENEPRPLPGTTTSTAKASPAQSAVGPNTQSESEAASNVKPDPTVTQKTNEPSQSPVVGRETPKSSSQENATNTPSAQSNPQNAASNARSDTTATQDNNQLNPNASQNPEQTFVKLPTAASDISADQSMTQQDKSTDTASGLATPSESNDKPNPERATSQAAALNAKSDTKATQNDNQLNQNGSKNTEKTSTKLSASALNTSANQPTPEQDKYTGTASGLVTMSKSKDKLNPNQTTSKTSTSNAKSDTKATRDNNPLVQNASQNPDEPPTKLSAAALSTFADQSTSNQDKSTSTASGLGTTNESKDKPDANQTTSQTGTDSGLGTTNEAKDEPNPNQST